MHRKCKKMALVVVGMGVSVFSNPHSRKNIKGQDAVVASQ